MYVYVLHNYTRTYTRIHTHAHAPIESERYTYIRILTTRALVSSWGNVNM